MTAVTTSRDTRRLALVLAIATLALGASTLHLAHALKAERAGNAMPATPSPELPADPPSSLSQAAPTASSASAPVASPPASPTAARNTAVPDEAERETLQKRLDELTNPATRASRAADLKAALAPMMAQMTQAASLQPHEAEQLLDFFAESTLRNQQRATQCRLTPGCDPRTSGQLERLTEMRELERAVGTDVMRRIESAEARQRITAFGNNLPAGQELPASVAAALASALADEWRREIEGVDRTGEPGQLLHELAASVLAAGQLAAFRAQMSSLLERN